SAVPDVFPLKRLVLSNSVHRLEALVVAIFLLAGRILSLIEAQRVEHQRDIAAPRKLDCVVLVFGRAKPGRTVFADLNFAAVLVMAKYRRTPRCRALWQKNKRWHPLAGLHRIRDLLANEFAEVDSV